MWILTSAQMRAADRHAIDDVGMPAAVLMENAGAEVVNAMEDALGDLSALSVLVLCGTGNNGGDGMVVARRLAAVGSTVRAVLLGEASGLSDEAASQWRILRRLGVPARACGPKEWPDVREDLEAADIVVDAILGTGFHGALEGFLAEVVEDVNACTVPVVAVDVPSGLSGEDSAIPGPAIEAALTVTFAAPKICHVFAPSHALCGDLVVADIGIPEASLDATGSDLALVSSRDVAELVEDLAQRDEGTHKGTWGHVVVCGGAVGRTGAPSLSGLAALMSGTGLVTVATPSPCVASVAALAPELMQLALPSTDSGEALGAGDELEVLLERASVVVAGPGLGTGAGARAILRMLTGHASVPLVLDADALNILALEGLPDVGGARPVVLTPHPGELARLLEAMDLDAPGASQLERLAPARELARRTGAVVVVKGFRTIVVPPEGVASVIPTGGPGMATAGTGDVLAGLIGGLLAQGLEARDAAIAGAFLHGAAGDLAEELVGQMPLRATDLLRCWPQALRDALGADDDDDDEG